MFQVFTQSQKLSNSTANKIQAIQIAREGIEAVKNIRDTNWILFWSDTNNCWNVIDYDNDCVGTVRADIKIRWWNAGSNKRWYKIFQGVNNRWQLERVEANEAFFTHTNSTFRNQFKVWYDSNWLYTQSWSISDTKPLFTRLINFKYTNTDSNPLVQRERDEKVTVTSIVEWSDNSSSNPHKVEFSTVLTNWK